MDAMIDDSAHQAVKKPIRSRLLVSVRSLEEAAIVAGLNIGILDLKEPSLGALAPCALHVWQSVAAEWSGKVPLSAALGEFEDARRLTRMVPESFTYAKMGPAGCGSIDELKRRWSVIRKQLPEAVALVAVAYADHQAAECPPPLEVFKAASQCHLKTWLVDTFQKTGRTTLDHLTMQELTAIADLSGSCGTAWVLAGSIKLSVISHLRDAGLSPNWFGVRGDICDHLRTGKVMASRVREWLDSLSICGNQA